MSCVPLRSASPSFASRTSGSRPSSRRASSAGMTWPPTSTSPRPMSGSARWASGARSPDAPTLPWAGTTGWIPRVRKARSRSTTSGRQPECPRASVFARSRSIARTTSRGRARPNADGVAGEEVLLQPAGVGRRDERRRQVAEAGRDPVHDLAGGNEALDDGAGLRHPRAGVDVEAARGPATRDRLDVGDGQVGAREDDLAGGRARRRPARLEVRVRTGGRRVGSGGSLTPGG